MSAATSSRSEMVSGSPGAGDSKSPLSQQWPTITYLFSWATLRQSAPGIASRVSEIGTHFLVGPVTAPLRLTTTSGCCAP